MGDAIAGLRIQGEGTRKPDVQGISWKKPRGGANRDQFPLRAVSDTTEGGPE